MTQHLFVVADPHRLVAFHLVHEFRRLLAAAAHRTDVAGKGWLAVHAPTFDGPLVWVGVEVAGETAVALGDLRVGEHLWRLLWALHVAVRRQRSPVLRLDARWLGAMGWGGDPGRWPRHWRGDLRALLATAERFHVAEAAPGERPAFDDKTALVYSHEVDAADRDGIEVEIGPAFLGSLEGLCRKGDGGKSYYTFEPGPRRRTADAVEDLGALGKKGRVQTVFAPALLPDPHVGLQLPVRVQRLLQAVLRETTLAAAEGKKRGAQPAGPDVVVGARVPNYGGRDFVTCPLLNAAHLYAGFNGKGKRRRLGYRLDTPGGWLPRCGYELGDVRDFLADVKRLCARLGVVAVGVHRDRMIELGQLVAWAEAGRYAKLEGVHLRLYAPADYADRWAQLFAMSDKVMAPGPAPATGVDELRDRMNVRRVSVREVAGIVGVSAAHVSRVLNGHKSPTHELLARLTAAVERTPSRGRRRRRGGSTPVALAKDYYARGWVTIPQQPGTKRPAVKWKEYQEQRPSESEVAGLFDGRPDAGLMLVLGPVSGVLVIDVDGAEAEEVLVERLGGLPRAPRSGRGDPHRFHLFFRHPAAVRTSSKHTPWHPKLEFKGQGGLVVLPPSRHPSGSRYEWAPGASPDDLPLPEVPAAVLAALRAVPSRAKGPAVPPRTKSAAPPVEVDACPKTREFLTGVHAHSSNWNNRLYLAACDLNGRRMPLDEAMLLLLDAADPIGQTDDDLARRTVESAYSQARVPGVR